ncbi:MULTISPECIES: right-handed parallel beta-helix repeat-containing protein [unclassified Wenzhouxiangella]|uniref:right-handed parallel beta-helix repeat-containing protein n=1 Tax=unclassified Wenzhouxiangella TaxID=2613841 RepID=UPI0015F27B74|nr:MULTISPECIES: right-handed parallel beta-helix repeat-containing protein [unclassified Wenzhouxiangella]
MFRLLAFPVFLMVILVSVNAVGDEGVFEINQACAEGDGCFSGDSPGFPVQIPESGSYVLTSGLNVPAATNGLDLSTGNVTIDLNGFAIIGPETCNGTPVTDCSGDSSEAGIRGPIATDVTVRNGKVSGVPGMGIYLDDRAEVLNVRVYENGSAGINLGADSTARGVSARRNGNTGIFLGPGSTARDIRASGNGLDGVNGDQGLILSQSIARNNSRDGISASDGSSVRNSVAKGNGNDGVFILGGNSSIKNTRALGNGKDGFRVFGSQSVVVDSVADGNGEGGIDIDSGGLVRGSSVTDNTGNGIFLRGGNSSVIDSTVNNNGDDGIDCDPDNADAVASGVKGNVLIGNASLALKGCTEIGTNLCGGGTSC